ncbi:RagB/SusD family nutrient uptake outer membrane protein [Olivibacter sp. SDN3]|uniref:RagB/SusD family nutrient uptake outer membrane protein n=1 Tax=Olivibacter sp. SDN3 TaxID=2764720 RepID=UPI0016515116|nr:RagB/SusD family nutrient uptake outer membrane protein [Olivibacter sp. SDN3]QNL50545.1 RagB/SusD family nutrient uptake outer membrane protein [Olivibacter sp. SDN3]
MKVNILYMVLFAFCLLFPTACKKDFLDKEPDEDMTLDQVFAERQYAERWLTSAYFNLPEEISFNDWWGRNPFVGAADEMEITWTYPFAHQMTAGAWNPTNVEENIWRFNWEGIRKASIFLDNIHLTPMAEADKNIWIGEATFLRAFFHFWQMRAHGPIPIVDKAYTAEDDYSEIRRMPIEQCVAFVAAQCDAAAALLPATLTSDKYGRPTKAAALALKARALLYMASPLWNGNTDYSDFLGTDGERLFPTYDASRWQVAADAAKACIDEANAVGAQLYRAANGDPVRSYQELFLNRFNSEVLFARLQANWDHQERATSPNGMGGWSGYCPSQELIDAYQMDDGSTPISGYNGEGQPIIDPSSGYQETGYATQAHPNGYHPDGIRNMYVGREPRFYASINYSGANWRGRRIEFWNTGIDGRAKGGPDYTATGYLMKKFSDETVNIPQGRFTHKTWIYFRLGEQYLNYAEALNEAQGPVQDVYDHVNAIRNRAGLPDLESGLSQDQMREHIRHERRIELAFETHRYFDTRRWKIAEATDNKNFYRLNIGEGTNLQDDIFYERVFLKRRVFDRNRHYLWPIPQTEINRTPTIVQNPNW